MPLPGQVGPYLRVLRPIPKDGMNLIYVNDRPVFQETHLPLSAKRGLEEENSTLPDQLKMKIEVVQDDDKPDIPQGKRKTIEEVIAERVAAEVAKLTQGISEKMLQAKPFEKRKAKPGPKKKVIETEKV